VTESFRSSPGAGWAVAAAVEQGECDEVVGVGEPVGDAGQDPDLGVRRLDQPIGEPVEEGVEDAGEVLADPAGQLDERGEPGTGRPRAPGF